jgi:hypothetical protein
MKTILIVLCGVFLLASCTTIKVEKFSLSKPNGLVLTFDSLEFTDIDGTSAAEFVKALQQSK